MPSLAKEMGALSRTRKAYRSSIVTTRHPLLPFIEIVIEVGRPASAFIIDHHVAATIVIATQARVRTPAQQGKKHDDEAVGGGFDD